MHACPRLTAHLPGSLGVLAPRADDFEVHEILAYAPTGDGEHLFIEIEKIGITTPEALRRVARALGLLDARGEPSREIGYAGLKDRHARARQWISIPLAGRTAIPSLDAIESDDLRILRAARHPRKLRRGHQRANRFSIRVRDVPEGGAARAQAILAELRRTGVPNAFGPQRFGNDGRNVERALGFLRGTSRPPRDRRLRELLISALQSEVFNRALEIRIRHGLFATALFGDVMQKHATGGLFDVADPAREQPRVDAIEISPTAALPGKRARKAGGRPQEIEDQALLDVGLSLEDVSRFGADGTRRSLRYPLGSDAWIDPVEGTSFRIEMTLPGGAYATVVLDELVKPPEARFDRAPIEG